jgi:hypothetical protein
VQSAREPDVPRNLGAENVEAEIDRERREQGSHDPVEGIEHRLEQERDDRECGYVERSVADAQVDQMCACEAPQLEVGERGAIVAKKLPRAVGAERHDNAQDRDDERCYGTREPCPGAGRPLHDSSVTLVVGRVCYLRCFRS